MSVDSLARARRPRLSAVVGRMTAANVLIALGGFVTGPLLARALGAHGRGELAAVLVPLGLAPYVLAFGLPAYATREAARGRPLNEIVGSLGLPLLAVGAVAAVCAPALAAALAEGRDTVRVWLIVSFVALPPVLLGLLLHSCLIGLERWRRVIATRLIPVGVSVAATAVLFAVDRLTVATAAAVAVAGGLLTLVPTIPLLSEGGRPAFRRSTARAGLGFGLKTWIGSLAAIANVRLDQLVMITAVAPRELGLYAVSVTLAGACHYLITAVTPPLLARVSAGELHLLPRALRTTLAATVVLDAAIAAVTPVLLPALFGPDFRDAIDMALVLLVAGVPFAGASVLAAGLQADGAPLAASLGEGVAIAITAAGLALLLGPLGGLGAAIASLAAYSASFAVQLVLYRRRFGGSLRSYLLPGRDDVRWARGLV